MKVITPIDTPLSENKTLVNLLAIASLVILGTVLAKTTDFSTINPFGNNPQRAGLITGTQNTASPVSVPDVVTAALAFKATLTTAQQATLEQTYTTTLARKWSNLPCGSGCRNGIQFATLTAAQLTAALAVIQAATGTGSNNGYEEFLAIRAAEEALQAAAGGSNYDEGLYWISYLGTPSATGAWMLQFGGHHYASNISFNNGHVIGATPYFMGVEPTTYTVNGTTYAPMEDEITAFRNMLASLTTAQFNTAKLTTTFSDCLMSPGESNGNTNTMPATKVGLVCSGLTTAQQDLIVAAMQNYVSDLDATTAASLMALYTSELNDTYIAFTGSATVGSASTFLSTNTNYVRIDGPHVWIEFVCQTGVVFPSQIHYHTVWRDHVSDYGVDLSGSSVDDLGISDVRFASKIKVYPNPATDILNISNDLNFSNATLYITDLTGRAILKKTSVTGTSATINLSSLSDGTYLVRIEDNGKSTTSKFIKK
jgi:Protein of unknown function (DUF3500)/Secretion system C-terminal sorting domain